MYAIVDVKDKQFKVREDDTLYVPYHSDADVDQQLTLDRVLLLSNEDGDVTVGTPTVDDATVTARVVDHVKGDKVIVFKKKRRKRYRVKRGHRQQYTQIQIESLNADGEAPSPVESTESEPADEAEEAPSDEAPEADAAEEATDEAEATNEADTAEDEESTDEADANEAEASADTDEAADAAETDADEDASDDDDDKSTSS